MKIHFESLSSDHFPLLLKWLEMPHVKDWWDQDIDWTAELIREKYTAYVSGYKDGKPIQAFVIAVDDTPIGYIQLYNVHDFPREYETIELPISCAGFDWYIGEPDFTSKGIGSEALSSFIDGHISPKFDHVYVHSDAANKQARRAYEKAGIHMVNEAQNGEHISMIGNTK